MVISIVIILILSQLISFYFIVILNTKISKFKDLEKRQDQLIREMDDAISLYLVEMKEENDRLIQELSSIKQAEFEKNGLKTKNMAMMNEELSTNSSAKNDEPKKLEPTEEVKISPKSIVPKTMVTNAYKQHKQVNEVQQTAQVIKDEKGEDKNNTTPTLLPFEQKVLNLHRQGKKVDEIAKIMQKGKTEIELLLKFHA